MITWRPGMGDVDLSALAQAISSGGLKPSYIDGQYWQPSYKSTPELLNKYLYLDDTTAARIASLLGGSVFQAIPTDLGPNASSAPLSNWIRLADGNVLNAALATPHWLWGDSGSQSECMVEDLLALNVPGGRVSATCAAQLAAGGFPVNGPGAANAAPEYIPPQAGTVAPPSGQLIITDQGGYQTTAPGQKVTAQPTPAAVPTPATTSGSTLVPAVTQPASAVSAANNPPAFFPVNSSGAQSSGASAGGAPPASDWTSIFTETSIGSIPNWVWLAGAAVAFMAFSSSGGRR
jgi:hypothetical protein